MCDECSSIPQPQCAHQQKLTCTGQTAQAYTATQHNLHATEPSCCMVFVAGSRAAHASCVRPTRHAPHPMHRIPWTRMQKHSFCVSWSSHSLAAPASCAQTMHPTPASTAAAAAHQAVEEVPQPAPERQAAPRLARSIRNSSSAIIPSSHPRRLPQLRHIQSSSNSSTQLLRQRGLLAGLEHWRQRSRCCARSLVGVAAGCVGRLRCLDCCCSCCAGAAEVGAHLRVGCIAQQRAASAAHDLLSTAIQSSSLASLLTDVSSQAKAAASAHVLTGKHVPACQPACAASAITTRIHTLATQHHPAPCPNRSRIKPHTHTDHGMFMLQLPPPWPAGAQSPGAAPPCPP